MSRPYNPHARLKPAFAHCRNIQGFIEDFGLHHCALLTLVFPRRINWLQANQNLERAQRTLIDRMFAAWICVVENHKDGRPHFHFVLACAQDIRAGYDFDARDRAVELARHARTQHRKMTRQESTAHRHTIEDSLVDAHALRAIWSDLRSALPHYGFGRLHPGTMEPVKSAGKLANYLVKSFGADALPRPAEMKGARLVRYSKGQNRRATQSFAWNGPQSQLHRRQVARIAAALDIGDGQFGSVYGGHWHYWCTYLIRFLEFEHGKLPDESSWPTDAIIQAAKNILPSPNRSGPLCSNGGIPGLTA